MGEKNVFGRAANTVDTFFSTKYYRLGNIVGSRPFTTIGVTFAFVLLCVAGFSQLESESRPEKLWIPQGTQAQDDSEVYERYFPSTARIEDILIEAKSGSVTDKDTLVAAMELHDKIEKVTYSGKNLRSMCVEMGNDGHPCFIQSALGTWSYSTSTLKADADPLASINKQGWSAHDLRRLFGEAVISNDKLVSALAMRLTYFIKSHRKRDGGGWVDDLGEGYEEELLRLLGCLDLKCKGKGCTCNYNSPHIRVYPSTQRSFSDAFGSVIRGDVNLTMAAYFIMIFYMVINLGNLCHKVKSRSLLAVAAVASIVIAGAAGFGIAMWLQFKYTPVHTVLPFVLLGIGVDDSFVIVNALDHTDPSDSVPKRIAGAISKAGVSVMVTSLTDFVAFCISVSSALPALSSFCMYAALSILMMFVIQLTIFTACSTLDTRRMASNRIDCLFCLKRGCPCCPTVPEEDARAAVARGEKDPNQLCCRASQHSGGYLGWFLETKLAVVLVRKPVSIATIVLCFGFCGLCIWQTTKLSVQDTQRKFIPDNTYVSTTLSKNDKYFGTLGQHVWIVIESGDYFKSQAALADIGTRVGKLDYMQPTTGRAFESWAENFKKAVSGGTVGITVAHTGGIVADKTQYYKAVDTWLSGSGKAYAKDVKWVSDTDPQKGIMACRISAEYKPINSWKNDQLVDDSDKAIEIMDDFRDVVESWSDMPGNSFAYSQAFLGWETFRIIKKELYMSLGLCLGAVFIITMVLIAHPLTAFLVFICVVMTIVNILGCINMWGLAIDNVTVIQLVISVGLCVDYSAHVGHSFMTHEGSRAERVTATLGNVGVAVLNGGMSTFLATALLGMSQSYVFRILFISFFLTVLMGMFHGMVLLPSLLNLAGPASYGGHGGSDVKEVEAGKPPDNSVDC